MHRLMPIPWVATLGVNGEPTRLVCRLSFAFALGLYVQI